MNEIRNGNFKIGCLHGKLDPKSNNEAKIRNDIYLTGMVKIEESRKKSIPIKIVAYEMPIEKTGKRNKCIDLLGYDKNLKPYIIELKKPKSTEDINDVIKQINLYAKCFDNIRTHVEKEIQEKYLWNDFIFSSGIGKIILSSRYYFRKKSKIASFTKLGIFTCSFSGIKENIEDFEDLNILKKCGSKGIVRLKIENRKN